MKILSPAKINLFLHITGKRENGYHDLFTLFCCISLYDTLFISFGERKTTLTCNNLNIPEGKENLAVKAADFFFKAVI